MVIKMYSLLTGRRQIRIDRIAPRLGDPEFVLLQRCLALLFRRATIHRRAQHIPSTVRIDQETSIGWRRGGQRQHDRTDRRQLVVQCTRLSDVARLERHLQTATSHAESHRVQMDDRGSTGWTARDWQLRVDVLEHCTVG